MKLGRPEQFHDKEIIRFRSIERAIAQYQFSADKLKADLAHMVDEHTTMYLKGMGNEINLLAATRELFFSSRELIDLYLGRISSATKKTGAQTPKDFVPFCKRLVSGDFDQYEKPVFAFLKTNFNYLFHIRKFRNEIKTDPSVAEFHFNTDHFELRMILPIKPEDEFFLEHLEINNLQEAKAKKSYAGTLNLDIYFPEVMQFLSVFKTKLDESFGF